FQAEDGIRDATVTGVQTCALPISYVLQAGEPIVVCRRVPLPIWSPSHSQAGILGKLTHKGREVVLIKCDVGIHVANDVVLQILHSGVSRVEGSRLTSKMSLRALRLSHELDPIVLRGIRLHHLVRAVRRTVADTDPFGWSD